jgi:hypothetical protein
MYGDTDVMRRQAGRLREQGDDLRALADRLVAQAEGVPWSGRAADAMRERARERATRIREAADRHDTAAGSLDVHLAGVEQLKDSIAEAERRTRNLLDDGDLTGFEPPAPGHKDWLSVALPGPGDRGAGG